MIFIETKRYHWLAYYCGLREGRSLKPHHVRDGAAFAELSVPMQRRGYTYGSLISNGPLTADAYTLRTEEFEAAGAAGHFPPIEGAVTYTPIDTSFLRFGDKIVVPTRPPLSDLDHHDKVRSQPGFTTIEQLLFRLLRRYLSVCSRSHVCLSPAIAALLSAEHANRADVTFRQVKAPSYKKLKRLGLSGRATSVRREAHKTAAYVLHLTEVERLNGADLFVAFGMGGTHTLILAHRLRNDLDWVFDTPGFTMFEMTAKDEAAAAGGLESADRWSFDVLVHADPIPEPSQTAA